MTNWPLAVVTSLDTVGRCDKFGHHVPLSFVLNLTVDAHKLDPHFE